MMGSISLLMVPFINMLSDYDSSSQGLQVEHSFSLGDIGGAEAICKQARLKSTSKDLGFSLECNPGHQLQLDAVAFNTQRPMFEVGIT